MSHRLHSENTKQRLFISMLIIILSILFISVPVTLKSYRSYQQSDVVLTEISVLRHVADLANEISRERGPANKVMSSTPDELSTNLKELTLFRERVDLQIEHTMQVLNSAGFAAQANALTTDLKPALAKGRAAVDAYAAQPYAQRSSAQLDQAIQAMFRAWDEVYEVLKHVMMQSEGKKTMLSESYSLILVLADLRDQAGRLASTIMAAVTFKEPIPEQNLAYSLQSQRQSYYLWDLVNSIQPEQHKTPEYLGLHQQVKQKYLDQGVPIVSQLIEESLHARPYSLSGTELTLKIVDKFTTVVNLQKYLLDYSVWLAQQERHAAWQQFILTLSVSIISLLAALFTMVYARFKVFKPLIEARDLILELSEAQPQTATAPDSSPTSLFAALKQLQARLAERDLLEFQLRNMANTDTLTGVSNRLALEEYIQYLNQNPDKLHQTGLIIIDIDDFKEVNDQYGHIVGDRVIQGIAEVLKHSVRSSDLIVRYGGDEFLILIEQIDLDGALSIAEKLRQEISQNVLTLPGLDTPLNISVSAGVAADAGSWMELFGRADHSLFKAKEKGRNRVESML
ncbi:GGDEF domain-containing protein [Acinetobacter indicus]|uniref:GGDEF domain-containing protein n=1 Tax=Acinetobacter indicus TaxID=756892 RepID=UPI001364783F|nr:diguanylate cyclase [Acinetobacter indicus]